MLRQRPVDRIHELLPMLYAFWALAALGRAIYQYVARQPHDALPTHLSALAGLLYLVIAGLLEGYARQLVGASDARLAIGGIMLVFWIGYFTLLRTPSERET